MTTFTYDRDMTLHGVGWMLASGLCFVAVTGIVRHLGTDLPAAQAAFLRFAFAVVYWLTSREAKGGGGAACCVKQGGGARRCQGSVRRVF